ncbi:uncharacterized protein LOC132705661 isoform X2 [Cylas formicarius]|nr:uncharacterized protein LOC132705661 isoform X2 [Cylas formicarius]
MISYGADIPCDDSEESFSSKELPDFYDETLFRKGQALYHDNIFGIFSAKFFGLLSILPSILRVLVHTRMSGSDLAAYRRYMGTIFHMNIWYDHSFMPGSKSWKSIKEVKSMHNSASKRCSKGGLGKISQMDMALTQFGFMGYQLTRSNWFGIGHITDEEWKGFVHLWRVVGYVLGIENRFNICRNSVEETRQICEKLIQKVFVPHVGKQDKDFLKMSEHLTHGLWCMSPLLNFNVVMVTLQLLLENDSGDIQNRSNKLTTLERITMLSFKIVMLSLKWKVFRLYFNFVRYLELWLMRVCPFLAYYKFGYVNSHVRVLAE